MHSSFLVILFRWLHILAACVAVGGTFFMCVLAPIGLGPLDPEPRKAAFLRLRRAFKRVVHPAILVFIISGIYNSWANWGAYHDIRESAHPLWGIHVLLALIIFAIALYVLAGREPPAKHARWMSLNVVLMIVTLAVAAGLKYVRDNRPHPLGSQQRDADLSARR